MAMLLLCAGVSLLLLWATERRVSGRREETAHPVSVSLCQRLGHAVVDGVCQREGCADAYRNFDARR